MNEPQRVFELWKETDKYILKVNKNPLLWQRNHRLPSITAIVVRRLPCGGLSEERAVGRSPVFVAEGRQSGRDRERERQESAGLSRLSQCPSGGEGARTGAMRRTKRSKEAQGAQQQDEAAGDFNPETSKRERRKLQTKLQQVDSRVYDSQGRLVCGGVDVCDCLHDGCPGCFYPCSSCGSTRCGPACRRDRRWLYERLDTEGGDSVSNTHAGV